MRVDNSDSVYVPLYHYDLVIMKHFDWIDNFMAFFRFSYHDFIFLNVLKPQVKVVVISMLMISKHLEWLYIIKALNKLLLLIQVNIANKQLYFVIKAE